MEAFKKNPFSAIFRLLEEGPFEGSLNVISGPPGIGKTTLLAHLGIYRVIKGYQVIHATRFSTPGKVANFYESALSETTRGLRPKDVELFKEQLMQKRTILSFMDTGFKVEDLARTLQNLRAISYRPCCLLMDGFWDTSFASDELLKFLTTQTFETWLTAGAIPENLQGHPLKISIIMAQSPVGLRLKAWDNLKKESVDGPLEFMLNTNSLLLL